MNHIPPRAFRGIHIQVLDEAVSSTTRMNPEDAMVPCGIGHICKDLCRIIR